MDRSKGGERIRRNMKIYTSYSVSHVPTSTKYMPMPTLPPQLLSSPSPLLSSRGNLLSPAPTSHRSQGAGVKVRVIDR